MTGGITGVIFMSWLSFNAQYAIASGSRNIHPKDLAADQCPYSFTLANATIEEVSDEYIFPLYKISYMWFTLVGAVFTMLVALICSIFIFGFNDPTKVSPELITPMVSKRIYKRKNETSSLPATIKDTEF